MTMFLLLVTGHFLADFVFQSGFTEGRKGASAVRHSLIVAGTLVVCLGIVQSWAGLTAWAILSFSALAALMHVVQDWLVAKWQRRSKDEIPSLVVFAADQGIHLLTLACIALALSNMSRPRSVFGTMGPASSGLEPVFMSILLLTLGTAVAAVFLAFVLAPFSKLAERTGTDTGLPRAGLWIGICERLILMLAIASGSEVFAAVGFALAAKSVFRFRELDKRSKAEYYLLGSLMSISIAVVVGLGLRRYGFTGI